MKIFKNGFTKYFFEALIVAFGVVLGLFLSEWNAQRKSDKNVENTLIYITNEIESNVVKFENAIKYHEQIALKFDSITASLTEKDLDAIYYTNTKFKHFEIPGWKGLGTATPETIIFESAKISGVFQELNITTIKSIASIYKRLEMYAKFSQSQLDQTIAINSETKVIDVYRIIELMKFDILSFEKSLVNELNLCVKELREIRENNNFTK